ncbi:MAG TPA: GNAT family N-acetyltransferase [Anaerolineales bacterium]
MPVVIRRAMPQDAPELAQMRWDDSIENGTVATQPGAEFAASYNKFVRGALASHNWFIWLAESDGRIVAHIYVQIVDMVPRPGRFAARWGYVAAVYTVPEQRGKGIGSHLLQSVMQWAREEGLESLLLWSNGRSISLYERAGFACNPDVLELDLDS